MNLLDKNLMNELVAKAKEQPVEEVSDFELFESFAEFDRVLADLNRMEMEAEKKKASINLISEVKSHIGKFGISEEILSLYGEDLTTIGITKDTNIEVALETLEDIIENNTNILYNELEISEEAVGVTIAAWLMANFGLAAGIASGVIGAAVLVTVITAWLVLAKSTMQKLKQFKANIASKGWKEFKDVQMTIEPAAVFAKKVDACATAIKFISTIDPVKALDTDVSTKANILAPLGWTFDAESKTFKMGTGTKLEKKSLSELGWTEQTIATTVDKVIGFDGAASQMSTVVSKLKTISNAKKTDKGEPIPKDKREEVIANAKAYKQFMKISLEASKILMHQTVSLAQKTIK